VLTTLSPMLASSGPMPTSASAWAFEPKLDGWRVIVYVHGQAVDIVTRSGRRITDSVPELRGLATAVDGDAVFDAELIAGQGLPDDFYRLGPRLAATRPAAVRRWCAREPLTLGIFDLLAIDGESVMSDPYEDRRLILEGMALSGPRWLTVSSFVDGGADLLDACVQLGFEGLVAKRLDSRYECGRRSRHWVKVKTEAWRAEHGPRRHEHDSRARTTRVVS